MPDKIDKPRVFKRKIKTKDGYYKNYNNDTVYKYPIGSNLLYLTKETHKMDKTFIPLFFTWVITYVIVSNIWSFFNRAIVNFILKEGGEEKQIVWLLTMGAIVIVSLLLYMLFSVCNKKVWFTKIRKIKFTFDKRLYTKQFDTDYENLETPDEKNRFKRARNTVHTIDQLYHRLSQTFLNLFTILGWSAVLCTLSPWLILIILLPTLAYYFAIRYKIRWYMNREKIWIPIERGINYTSSISSDFQNAKDIRIYNMENWFIKGLRDFINKRVQWYKTQGIMEFKNGFIMVAIVALRDLMSYGFIVLKVIQGEMSAGDFMLYFSSIGSIADSFYHILDDLGNIEWMSVHVSLYREFLETPDKSNRGEGKPLPTDKFDIRFENVSYQYSSAEQPTLKNLNFTIKTGEKIAIVGNNGAGKTTLVKLLCGIYRRTDGEIYINDIPIDEYNRDELYTLSAAVFQDIHVMPASIAENIALSEDIDSEILEYSLFHSGISEKVSDLPEGINTFLVRSVYDNAIDLSGGEMQKLALARALYKQKKVGSKILLLDEPTAALDPIAEQGMYLEYAKFAENKTSVFISHRLASTQFCDKIFYLNDGEIKEIGTHKELLELGGEYKKMYEIQSRYYRDKQIKEKLEKEAM